jgi:hypothetical protein
LVQKGAVIYLICTRNDKTEVQTFALHRFKAATVLDNRALHPVNFDIDNYIVSDVLNVLGRTRIEEFDDFIFFSVKSILQ